MFAAHLLWIEELDYADTSTWIAVVDGRSSILFATLAGVSIGLVTGGERPLAPADMHIARGRLTVRAALLWLLGIWLIATGVPVFVILPAYAILFLLALPLVSLGARALLLLAGALALVMPSRPAAPRRPPAVVDAIGTAGRRSDRLALPVPGLDRVHGRRPRRRPRRHPAHARAAVAARRRHPARRCSATGWMPRPARTRHPRSSRTAGAVWTARAALQRAPRGDRLGGLRPRRDRSLPARMPHCRSHGSCFRCERSGRCR